jgi:hypothetical protein
VVDGGRVRGQVIYVDHFGNLVTNVEPEALPGGAVTIRLGSAQMAGVAASYDAVGVGQPVTVINSWGLLEIAVRDGSARAKLGGGVGDEVLVEPIGP